MHKLDKLGANKVYRTITGMVRRNSRHSEPSTAGSTIFGKAFLTASLTLYSLQSSELVPCGKKPYSFSLNDPESAKCISCRYGNVHLQPQQLLIDNCWFTCVTDLVKLFKSLSHLVDISTFQFQTQSIFLACSSFFRAQCRCCRLLVSFLLILLHQMRRENCGQTAIYWI